MYKKILIATDGSETAAKAVGRGREVAGAVGADVVVFTVGSLKQSEGVLADAATTFAGTGLNVETLAEEGDPASAILDVAEAVGADLIVVGNKGMTGARRFFLSAVPNKVAHHARCAVLVVKTT